MKKNIKYFFTCNGLYFSFDYVKRDVSLSLLRFFSSDFSICSLDLNVSKLVFTNRYITNYDTIYYFEIVPVGGAINE